MWTRSGCALGASRARLNGGPDGVRGVGVGEELESLSQLDRELALLPTRGSPRGRSGPRDPFPESDAKDRRHGGEGCRRAREDAWAGSRPTSSALRVRRGDGHLTKEGPCSRAVRERAALPIHPCYQRHDAPDGKPLRGSPPARQAEAFVKREGHVRPSYGVDTKCRRRGGPLQDRRREATRWRASSRRASRCRAWCRSATDNHLMRTTTRSTYGSRKWAQGLHEVRRLPPSAPSSSPATPRASRRGRVECRDEVAGVPDGRLFALIDGYIVHVTRSRRGVRDVANGKGSMWRGSVAGQCGASLHLLQCLPAETRPASPSRPRPSPPSSATRPAASPPPPPPSPSPPRPPAAPQLQRRRRRLQHRFFQIGSCLVGRAWTHGRVAHAAALQQRLGQRRRRAGERRRHRRAVLLHRAPLRVPSHALDRTRDVGGTLERWKPPVARRLSRNSTPSPIASAAEAARRCCASRASAASPRRPPAVARRAPRASRPAAARAPRGRPPRPRGRGPRFWLRTSGDIESPTASTEPEMSVCDDASTGARSASTPPPPPRAGAREKSSVASCARSESKTPPSARSAASVGGARGRRWEW